MPAGFRGACSRGSVITFDVETFLVAPSSCLCRTAGDVARMHELSAALSHEPTQRRSAAAWIPDKSPRAASATSSPTPAAPSETGHQRRGQRCRVSTSKLALPCHTPRRIRHKSAYPLWAYLKSSAARYPQWRFIHQSIDSKTRKLKSNRSRLGARSRSATGPLDRNPHALSTSKVGSLFTGEEFECAFVGKRHTTFPECDGKSMRASCARNLPHENSELQPHWTPIAQRQGNTRWKLRARESLHVGECAGPWARVRFLAGTTKKKEAHVE